MKTKKTLQMLVAVVAMLTMLCSLMPAAYAEETEEMPSYQASDYYDSTDYTNPRGPWSWDYYDCVDQSYHKLEHFNTNRGYSIIQEGTYGNVTAINGTVMYPDHRTNGIGSYSNEGNTAYNNAWARYYPVRTFNVSKSGNITITADGGITGGAGTAGPSIRILLERDGTKTNIWPGDDYNKQTQNVTDFAGWREIYEKDTIEEFAPLTLIVEKGDKLRFEMSAEKRSSDAITSHRVNWDPIVTYVPLVTEYQASDEFVANTSNNPTANWTWNTYAYATEEFDGLKWNSITYSEEEYTAITKTAITSSDYDFSNTKLYPIPEGDSDTGDLLAISNDGLGIGKYWMRSFKKNTSNDETNGDRRKFVGLMSAVRTFTVNKAGEVTISAVDRNGDSKIESAHFEETYISNDKNKRGVRVLIESDGVITQLWPSTDDTSVSTGIANGATFALVPANKSIDFPKLTTTLQAGDKLHFELANVDPCPMVDSTADDTLYGCAVYWDPKITYTTGVVVDDVTFKKDDDELKNFADVVGADGGVTVTIPATAHLTSEESVTPIVAVYNQDRTMVLCGLGTPTKLSMNVPTNLTVELPAITGAKPATGYVKVFLLDTKTMKPISDIGTNPYF